MKKTIGAAVITLALLAPLATQAQTTVSANAGWLSQYYYRGIEQKVSSANAGLDLGVGPVYLGTWSADVGDGAEIDLYGGVGVDLDGLSLSVGGTGYFYTGQYDDTYLEGNFNAGYGPLSVEFSYGTYQTDPEDLNYWFLGITAEQNGFYGTFGALGGDDGFINDAGDTGVYGEAGYGFTAGDMDFTVSAIFDDSKLSGEVDANDEPTEELTWVFGISKSFDLFSSD
jgi:uncharacterized protein (TIGR02001 family)